MSSVSRAVALAVALLAASAAGAQQAPPAVEFEVTGFLVEGENPLSADETAAVLDPYTGRHSGLDGLVAAADALEQVLRERGFTFHRVLLPAQTLAAGTVSLQVVAFKVGKVTVTGNEHFSRENILASVPTLQAGTVPNPQVLSRELALANQHSSKQVAMGFKQGEEAEAVDANLKVEDEKPWSVFAALSNTGSDDTGNERLSVGGQYSNLFDLDHALTLSYTTSPGHWSDVKQYGANYRAPIYPLAGALDAYYVKSDVDSGTIGSADPGQGFFDVSGGGEFFGLRWSQMLGKRGAYNHEVSIGFDHRRFSQNVQIPGLPAGVLPPRNPVRSTPLSVRYSGSYEAQQWQGGFSVEYARNLPVFRYQESVDYARESGRGNASPNWDAVRAQGNGVFLLPSGWAVQGRVAAQVGREPLIPGEQFGAGGAASVRGFDEREASGDDGITASAELWTPPLPHDTRMLAFVDAGRVWLHNAQPGQVGNDTLLSAGLGLRWQWQQNVGLQVDVARVIEGAADTPNSFTTPTRSGDYKLHFNLFARF